MFGRTKIMKSTGNYSDEIKRFVTITPYGKDIEPNVPDIPEVIETFKRLSEFP